MENIKNIITIYERRGVLAHEYESVWSIARPEDEAYYEHLCSLPYGYQFAAGVLGDLLIEDVSSGECCPVNECLVPLGGDTPRILVSDGRGGYDELPLIEW